jgi:hypothetical protein
MARSWLICEPEAARLSPHLGRSEPAAGSLAGIPKRKTDRRGGNSDALEQNSLQTMEPLSY